MLEIWLALCHSHQISQVLVNIHAHANAVKSFVQAKDYGVQVTVVEEQELFGSAGTLRANRNWLAGDTKFWVFYADVLTSADLGAMLRSHSPGCAATLGVYSVPDPQRCGIAPGRPGSHVPARLEILRIASEAGGGQRTIFEWAIGWLAREGKVVLAPRSAPAASA